MNMEEKWTCKFG